MGIPNCPDSLVPFFLFAWCPLHWAQTSLFFLLSHFDTAALLFSLFFFFPTSVPRSMGSNTSRLIRDSIDRHIRLQTCRDLVDYGSVSPNGLYLSASANHDLDVVRELIVSRKLSPFYTGKKERRLWEKRVVA